MHVLKPKDFSDLSVTQRRIIVAQLPRDWHARTRFSKEISRLLCHGDGVVGAVEHLEAEAALLDGQVANLTEIAGVDIRPCIALSRHGFGNMPGEIMLICRGYFSQSNQERRI